MSVHYVWDKKGLEKAITESKPGETVYICFDTALPLTFWQKLRIWRAAVTRKSVK